MQSLKVVIWGWSLTFFKESIYNYIVVFKFYLYFR